MYIYIYHIYIYPIVYIYIYCIYIFKYYIIIYISLYIESSWVVVSHSCFCLTHILDGNLQWIIHFFQGRWNHQPYIYIYTHRHKIGRCCHPHQILAWCCGLMIPQRGPGDIRNWLKHDWSWLTPTVFDVVCKSDLYCCVVCWSGWTQKLSIRLTMFITKNYKWVL